MAYREIEKKNPLANLYSYDSPLMFLSPSKPTHGSRSRSPPSQYRGVLGDKNRLSCSELRASQVRSRSHTYRSTKGL